MDGSFTTAAPEPTSRILPAGTQVVARVETPAGDMMRPIGAVAVIITPPGTPGHAYRVRFVDGGEATLHPRDFAIRKQHRSDQRHGVQADRFEDLEPFVILRCVVGSRAHGLETEASDTDRRGIYLPPAARYWSLAGVPEQIERDATQEAYWELQKAITLALRANPTVLETLFSPVVETVLPPADELLAERHRFLSRLVYQTYNGYVLSQFKRLQADLRTTGEVRWKHVMHLLRLLLAGIAVLREGTLSLDAGADRSRLLEVRSGMVPWAEVESWRRSLHRELDAAYRVTLLPERPDTEWADRFLIRARRAMVDR